jgi:L-alanine-DL-glutamate epimerase-like enolase superfamily enzyme
VRIESAQTMILQIPFGFPGTGEGITSAAWRSLEFALVRLEDDEGNVGWGEGFGYFAVEATKALMDRLLIPGLVGTEVTDICAWNEQAQRDLHLFGRNGVSMFAISGIDIALWDLAAKQARRPLWSLLSGSAGGDARLGRAWLSCYASLMRYGDRDLAVAAVEDVMAAGHTALKLHETGLPEIAACREALGTHTPLSVDVNCQWSAEFVRSNRARLREMDLAWLEEPVFPPDDFATLSRLRSPELPLAAGENWAPARQFEESADAVDIWQPSVTKVGGISEYLKITEAATRLGRRIIPHCPYFGPGYFATLHLAAVHNIMDNIEVLWAQPEAWLCEVEPLRHKDRLRVPELPGLGFEPAPDVIRRYRQALGLLTKTDSVS